MTSRNQIVAGLTLALLFATALPGRAAIPFFGSKKKEVPPGKKLTAAQSALIDKALLREKEVIKVVKERAPLVETYIQNMKPDPVMRQVPDSDEHFLGRVEFGKVIGDDQFKAGPKAGEKPKGKLGFFKGSFGFLSNLGGSLHLQFKPDGFDSRMMLLMDSNGNFDKQHYNFYFVRNDFLGSDSIRRCSTCTPQNKSMAGGRFFGRIWVETAGRQYVVRYQRRLCGLREGLSTSTTTSTAGGRMCSLSLWMPTSFYVEESDPKSQTSTLKFKAINHVWGYVLKVPAGDRRRTPRCKGSAAQPTFHRTSRRTRPTPVRARHSVSSPGAGRAIM